MNVKSSIIIFLQMTSTYFFKGRKYKAPQLEGSRRYLWQDCFVFIYIYNQDSINGRKESTKGGGVVSSKVK
jgi:hypothetical protein